MKKTLPSDGLIPLGARQNRTPRGISVAPLTPTPSPILLDTNDLIEEVLLHWSQQSNLQRVEHLLLSSMDILFTKSSSIVTERFVLPPPSIHTGNSSAIGKKILLYLSCLLGEGATPDFCHSKCDAGLHSFRISQ